jgi:hypothetical protein
MVMKQRPAAQGGRLVGSLSARNANITALFITDLQGRIQAISPRTAVLWGRTQRALTFSRCTPA